MLKKLCLLTAFLLLPLAAAQALPSNASYLQLGYTLTGSVSAHDSNDSSVPPLPPVDNDYTGWQARGTLNLSQHLYLTGQYNHGRDDDQAFSPSGYFLSSGIGAKWDVGRSGDYHFFAEASYEKINIANIQADGWGLTGGMVWQTTDKLRFIAHIGYVQYRGTQDPLGSHTLDGARYGIEATYQFVAPAAFFVDFQGARYTANSKLTYTDFRIEHQVTLGLRIYPTLIWNGDQDKGDS